jgi:NADPH-dependent glutamate synthase beta subunit-like oxidoreductase
LDGEGVRLSCKKKGMIMKDILFSSWGGRIVDNRGKDPNAYESVDHVELPEYFKKDERIKALFGWGGIILRSSDVDVLDGLREYIEANYEHAKTCDKCNYCKTGWKEQLEVFQDIFNGDAREEDLEFLGSSAEAIVDAGKCTIGKTGPTPVLHALKYFAEDFKQSLSRKKPETAHKYYSKLTAPCVDACPIHLDIPKYIELIKDAKFEQSLDVIRERLPLPGVVGRICVRPCEDHCRRALVDEPIAIMSLKRFVADQELAAQKEPEFQVTPLEKRGKVAMVGAGPAGITCAYHLARMGHKITIFEKLPLAGGMMAVGIPEYSLPPDVLAREIKVIEKMGVTIKTGVAFGDGMSLDRLKAEGFDAVFIGTGLHGSRRLHVEGEDLEGVIPGIQFLRDVALGKEIKIGKNILVVGGGNVAVDVARTVKRLGGDSVIMVCLEKREEMPAWDREIEGAIEEKIEIVHAYGPKRIQGKDGKVNGVEFKRCTRVFDENNRFNPEYDETALKALSAQTVILAIGQSADLEFVRAQNIPTSPKGGLHADPVTFQTELEWVFAGGDAVYGPESVVEAAASGKRAATSIDRFIHRLPVEPDNDDYFDRLFSSLKVYDPNEKVKQKVEPTSRRKLSILSPEARIRNFDEVEMGFTSPDAVAEAERCLRCYRVVTILV